MGKLESEFVWRMLGSIIASFCREFGVGYVHRLVKFIADNDDFWDLQTSFQEADPTEKPFERGAHDFMKPDNPPHVGEKEEL